MAHVTPQREGAIAAPEQQELPSTSEISAESAAGTRALLLPVDDTDVGTQSLQSAQNRAASSKMLLITLGVRARLLVGS